MRPSKLNENTERRDGQDVETALMSIPKDADPEVVPSEDRADVNAHDVGSLMAARTSAATRLPSCSLIVLA
jgi:hypothetical protein